MHGKQKYGPMTGIQIQLCQILQDGIPICDRPFEQIATKLGTTEQKVIELIKDLKASGLIRRLGPILNPRAIGRFSTLVMAHVPEPMLPRTINTINLLPNVSHNYLRDHHFNIWFTLQADTPRQAADLLVQLGRRLEIDLYNLPTIKVFKLKVYFSIDPKAECTEGLRQEYRTEPVILNTIQQRILAKTIPEIPIEQRPFASLAQDDTSPQQVIEAIQGLIQVGVIRRIAAVLDHLALGIKTNALIAMDVPQARIEAVADLLYPNPHVSHLVLRQPLPHWPYNLYAMVHADTMETIRSIISATHRQVGSFPYLALRTVRQLKKAPVPFGLASSKSAD